MDAREADSQTSPVEVWVGVKKEEVMVENLSEKQK